MALETATTVAGLNASNPVHTDGLNAADAHLRLIKACLLGTFVNFTNAPLNSTQAAIDAAVASVSTNGVAILADAGAFFKTNTTDGFTNPAAGEVDIKAGGVVVAQFKSDKSVTLPGALTATSGVSVPTTSGFAGPGATPLGAGAMWFTTALPSGGNWAWANGQAVSRTTYATLFALYGTTYGVGDGSTTFNLPDLRERVPVCQSTLGGTSAPGLITQYDPSVQGHTFGEGQHQLSSAEMPSHNHTLTDPGHVHSSGPGNFGFFVNSPGGAASSGSGVLAQVGQTGSATTGITLASTGGGGVHNNVQPSFVCSWIIRIA